MPQQRDSATISASAMPSRCGRWIARRRGPRKRGDHVHVPTHQQLAGQRSIGSRSSWRRSLWPAAVSPAPGPAASVDREGMACGSAARRGQFELGWTSSAPSGCSAHRSRRRLWKLDRSLWLCGLPGADRGRAVSPVVRLTEFGSRVMKGQAAIGTALPVPLDLLRKLQAKKAAGGKGKAEEAISPTPPPPPSRLPKPTSRDAEIVATAGNRR